MEAKDGQNKCPKCGATDISLNTKTGLLRCNFCRHEFEPEKVDVGSADIQNLEGENISEGSKDIDTKDTGMITLKCESCGAEVVIDTNEVTSARCHWCRHDLSINNKVPNGAVPDVVLPFKVGKKDAKAKIEEFVGKRKFFAHPKFKEEFSANNVMGVYLPYMVVDINSHASFSGKGEHEICSYTVEVDENTSETRYDAELYEIERSFDMTIDDLTIESSSDKLDKNSNKTNNIINAILPFDTENSVGWNASYIKGFSSEKRDVNVTDVKPLVKKQVRDIARFAANETLGYYDRGVKWENVDVDIKGTHWNTAYFPVWLYSYMQDNGLLHYVAVNARTQEVMGSVPIHKMKLFLFSLLVEAGAFIAMLLFDMMIDNDFSWLFLIAGFLFYLINYMVYRNTGERHAHEKETRREITDMKKTDTFIKKKTGLTNAYMKGANNDKIEG